MGSIAAGVVPHLLGLVLAHLGHQPRRLGGGVRGDDAGVADPVHPLREGGVVLERRGLGGLRQRVGVVLLLGDQHVVAGERHPGGLGRLTVAGPRVAALLEGGHAPRRRVAVADLDDEQRRERRVVVRHGGHGHPVAEPRLDVLGVVQARADVLGLDLLEDPAPQVVADAEVELLVDRRELLQHPQRLDLLRGRRVQVDARVGHRDRRHRRGGAGPARHQLGDAPGADTGRQHDAGRTGRQDNRPPGASARGLAGRRVRRGTPAASRRTTAGTGRTRHTSGLAGTVPPGYPRATGPEALRRTRSPVSRAARPAATTARTARR